MLRIRPRFSLRMMLVAVTVVATGCYGLMLPTVRARRFVSFVNAGQTDAAAAMLPASMNETSLHRQTLKRATSVTLQPCTIAGLLHGERRIIVDGEIRGPDEPMLLSGGDRAEFIVGFGTISPGWHGYLQW
jgi:hypothetical protein